MDGKTLTMRILGLLVTFVALVMLTLRSLSGVEQAILNEAEIITMFGFCCIVLGAELLSCTNQYWYYRYNKED